MQLRNKKTGEIKELQEILCNMIDNHIVPTLIAVENDWEDYEEPKEYYYYIDDLGFVSINRVQSSTIEMHKNFGNYFNTRKEAEKAVEKLKAVKRLKDKGFRFNGWGCQNQKLYAKIQFNKKAWATETEPDLDLLFGGEE